jgi:hypothetical protein
MPVFDKIGRNACPPRLEELPRSGSCSAFIAVIVATNLSIIWTDNAEFYLVTVNLKNHDIDDIVNYDALVLFAGENEQPLSVLIENVVARGGASDHGNAVLQFARQSRLNIMGNPMRSAGRDFFYSSALTAICVRTREVPRFAFR